MNASTPLQMPSPAFGILRARLDIKDAGLDLERVVQTSLRIYDSTQDNNASSSDSGGSQQVQRGLRGAEGPEGCREGPLLF